MERMPDTGPRHAKIPRPLLLRQIGMLLDMVTQGLPIQRPPLLRPGLAVGQRVRRFHPVINASPRNLKTTGRFCLASTAPYKRHYAPAYIFTASHNIPDGINQIYVQVIMGLAITQFGTIPLWRVLPPMGTLHKASHGAAYNQPPTGSHPEKCRSVPRLASLPRHRRKSAAKAVERHD